MIWDRILRPDIIWVLIPLAGVLFMGINGIVAQVYRHRERIAMIEQGMDPDAKRSNTV